MKEYNVWETGFKDDFIFFDNIDDFLKELSKDDYEYDFEIKDKYEPQQMPTVYLEKTAKEQNVVVNYTDKNHQFLIQTIDLNGKTIIISKEMFEKYKDTLIEVMRKRVLKIIETKQLVEICKICFSDELLDKAIENKLTIYLKDVILTEEQLYKIEQSELDVFLVTDGTKKQINKKCLIESYTKEMLENGDKFDIPSNIVEENGLKYIKFIRDNSKIIIENYDNSIDEYYTNVLKIIDEVKKQGKNLKIIFKIGRKNFRKYIETLKQYEDLDIELEVDSTEYTIKEYLEEDKKLDDLVKDIENSGMSPLEKYMAVYNIVKKFKLYKENQNNKQDARNIKYILNNEYMVCVGFANLLVELLDRVGIEAISYSTTVTDFNDNAEIEMSEHHSRAIVHIIDEKYGINGYYFSDPTWDNNKLSDDKYQYALEPFNKMQKSTYLFKLTYIDYILDNDNFSDFSKKINIYLDREMRSGKTLIEVYETVYDEIINLFIDLDKVQLEKLERFTSVDKYDRTEKFYEEFLTEVGHYIVSKSNNEVSEETIAQAATEAFFYNEDVTEEWKKAYQDKILNDFLPSKYDFHNDNPNLWVLSDAALKYFEESDSKKR